MRRTDNPFTHSGFRKDTREAIPGWDGLLYIYGIFFVPTFFALLVGINLLVWARARINYVFIFGASNSDGSRALS